MQDESLTNPHDNPLEAVGPHYDAAQMLIAREHTRAAVEAIAAAMQPGMAESEAIETAKDILADMGLLRGWHDVYVRFGRNTVQIGGAPADPHRVLGEDDIFLVDIGPCWQRWEGDGGDTFVTGSNQEMARCAEDVKAIFHEVRRHWLSTGATGRQLYEFAKASTERRGWELNFDLPGHRIADFPHKAIVNVPLSGIEFRPSQQLWVLEIHIRDKDRRFGAFFEDMLLDDLYFERSALARAPIDAS
ncbi:M24 family metallopeptidase [Burkholderia gladioli]|uniref:M24 family metallopeptidase n=1 Tax=Burkholderia gladioli TaxID=28095 RepID=UPI00163E44C8|nr:M24 family metallopeptidase [Burkholderia gladioli]